MANIAPLLIIDNLTPKFSRAARSLLGMLHARSRPLPDDSGDYWLEASARFVGVAVDLASAAAHRLLRAVAPLLGISGHRDGRALGVDLRALGRIGPRFGTIWRVPGALYRAISELLTSGELAPWAAPAAGREWFPVSGLDPSRPRGTCSCPNALHDGDFKRCAYQRHADGSWHLTCQTCLDYDGQALLFYAVPGEGGPRACLSTRSLAAGCSFEPYESSPATPPDQRRCDPATPGSEVFVSTRRSSVDPPLRGDRSPVFVPGRTASQVVAVAREVGVKLLAGLGLAPARDLPQRQATAPAACSPELPKEAPATSRSSCVDPPWIYDPLPF